MKVRNIFIIFIISGFWHGANWTFIIWGALNALYILPSVLLKTHRNHLDIVAQEKYLPTIKEFFSMALTFGLTVFAWIFFRAENMHHAIRYIAGIFSKSIFSMPAGAAFLRDASSVFTMSILIVLFMLIEWMGREYKYALEKINIKLPLVFRWVTYYLIIFCIVYFQGQQQQFIYFQF